MVDLLEGSTRADRAYAALKRRVLAGEFALNGRLGEERLAEMLGVSRTPVREALFRLHAEGLVERWADGGFRPVVPDVDLVRSTYEVRAAIELAAIRLPITTGRPHDPAALIRLRDEWRDLRAELPIEPDPAFVTLDEAFHVTLAEASGNPVVVDVLRQLNDRLRLVRSQDFLVTGRIEATIAEHLEIVEALIAGRPDQAADRFAQHLTASMAVVEDRVARAIGRMIAPRVDA
ncbi:MAG: GntR family transcriptional regulator [Actinomycetota bacterium]